MFQGVAGLSGACSECRMRCNQGYEQEKTCTRVISWVDDLLNGSYVLTRTPTRLSRSQLVAVGGQSIQNFKSCASDNPVFS